jgi:hypothetical protein
MPCDCRVCVAEAERTANAALAITDAAPFVDDSGTLPLPSIMTWEHVDAIVLGMRALMVAGDGLVACRQRSRLWSYTWNTYTYTHCQNRFDPDDTTCGLCPDCCEVHHHTCGQCGEHGANVSICDTCDTCLDCCDGWRCNSCGDLQHDEVACGDCNLCSSCCDCRSQAPRREPGRPFRADKVSDRKRNRSKRLIGFEFEFNNADDYREMTGWCADWRAGWHSDGSCGEEIVSAPLAGDHVHAALRGLRRAMNNAGATTSDDCSLHVHVDASDYGWFDVYRLIRLYSFLEPALYMLGGQHRTGNDYCNPCGSRYLDALHANDPKAAVMKIAFGRDVEYQDDWKSQTGARAFKGFAKPGKKHGNRYLGLNLLPWLTGRWGGKRSGGRKTISGVRRIGESSVRKPDCTIEFRIHEYVRLDGGRSPTTDDAGEWCQLLATILDWCLAAGEADIAALPRSPIKALRTIIAPRQAKWLGKRLANWRRTYVHAHRLVDPAGRYVEGRITTQRNFRINPINTKEKVYYTCAA